MKTELKTPTGSFFTAAFVSADSRKITHFWATLHISAILKIMS